MYALTRLFEGLLVAHVLWAVFFVTGTMLDGRPMKAPSSWSQALLGITTFSVAGMGIWALEGFAFGSLGLFNPAGLIIAFAINAGVFAFVRRENIASAAFWKPRYELVRAGVVSPALPVYIAVLVLSAPAVIPEFSYDGVHYHLAYPYEWFLAGRIFTDPYLRQPYYTLNNEVLDAWLFVARAGRFVPFLSWLAGAQAVLAITGLVARLDEHNQRERPAGQRAAANTVYLLAAASFMISAVFLRWWPTAMTDALACAAFFATTAALCESATAFDERWLRVACVCAGLLAGIKPSYLFFVPFFAVYVAVVASRAAGMRRALALICLLVAFASPWYLRNLVSVGDPIPPIFSLLLRRPSPTISASDVRAMQSDLQPHRTLEQWTLLPIQEFLNPQTELFREYGVTAVVVFIYAVVLITPVLVVRKSRPGTGGISALFAWTFLGLVYIACSSALTRYTLLVYPGIAACAAVIILDAAMLFKRGTLVAPLIAALTIVPSPGSREFYREYYDVYYRYLAHFMPSDGVALDRFVGGYQEARPIFHAPVLKRYPNVLLVEAALNYYVERGGGRGVGDYFGPVDYRDFAAAVDAGTASAYMDRHRIGALVVNLGTNLLVPDEVAYVRQQLSASGWTIEPSSDRYYMVLLRGQ